MQTEQDGAAGAGAAEAGAPAGEEAFSVGTGMALTDLDRRVRLVVAHLMVGVAVLAVWAAADAWQAVTGLGLACVLSVLAAIPAGFVFGTLVHEWGHFAGARLAGARYRVPDKVGLFVFDFDFRANTVGQFFTMSYGGQAGSVLAVLFLAWAVPLDTAGRAMLVSAAAGGAVFSAMIEWPVLSRTRVSGEPLVELSKIDKATLYRSAGTGAAATGLLWLLVG